MTSLGPTLLLLPSLLSAAIGAHAKEREWQVGTLLEFRQGTASLRTSGTATGTTQDGGFNATGTQVTRAQPLWTYVIDAGDVIYVASHKKTWRWTKRARVTVNAPVKFAVESDSLYLVDEKNDEHKLSIEQKVLKPVEARPPESNPASSHPAPEASRQTAQIAKGMTPAEVEAAIGKPLREVTFENKVRWTYQDLTVYFKDGVVVDVQF